MTRKGIMPILPTILLATALATGCGDGTVEPPTPPTPVPTTITISPASAALQSLGETAQLSAEVRDQNGQTMANAAVAWTSSDPSVATAAASGLVTAVANGAATVTATAGSASGTAAVTVDQVVAAVAVDPAVYTLMAFGDTVRLNATATDANGHRVEGASYDWTSNDPRVARVDELGLVEAIAEGTTAISADAGDVSGTGAIITVAHPDRGLLCDRDEPGYFKLANDVCIQLPRVRFTFTQRGGRELSTPTGDPTTIIKVIFDSEIVFLDDSGNWSEITPRNVLDMVALVFRNDPQSILRPIDDLPAPGTDLVAPGGLIDADLVFVGDSARRTVVTVSPPDGGYYPWQAIYKIFYDLSVANYAKLEDVAAIVESGSLHEYLQVTSVFYNDDHDGFHTDNWGTSCEVRASRALGSRDGAYVAHVGTDIPLNWFALSDSSDALWCGVDDDRFPTLGRRRDNVQGDDHTGHSAFGRRADPNRTYVIDVAFVTEEGPLIYELQPLLEDILLPEVSHAFQRSGANVEFRVAAVIRFSAYRRRLLCPIDLDGLHHLQAADLTREMLPMIRSDYDDVDWVFAILDYESEVGGTGAIRLKWNNIYDASYRASTGTLIKSVFVNAPPPSDRSHYFWKTSLVNVIAHEFGHILGLRHHKGNTVGWPVFNIFHPEAYGYQGRSPDGYEYGTIMRSGTPGRDIILSFSRNGRILRSELCSGYEEGWRGFCHYGATRADEWIRLGGMVDGVTVDATEALQYTLEDAAEFSEIDLDYRHPRLKPWWETMRLAAELHDAGGS